MAGSRLYENTGRTMFPKPSTHLNMSLAYHDHICIRWNVNRALDFIASESPSTSFRNSKLTFRLIRPANTKLLLMYVLSDPVLDGAFEIETFLLDKNGRKVNSNIKLLIFTARSISDASRHEEIWRMDRNVLFSDVDNLATNNMLNFVCIINSPLRCQEHGKIQNDTLPTDSSLEKLSLDVSNLYRTGEESDVSLKCGDQTISAHKSLLTARSDVFAAMLRNEMVERREGIIHISDIEFTILDLLLRYIYSGKVNEVSGNTAVQLYKAADKYAIDSLKRKCASFIVSGLTKDNACDILILADLHSDNDLKDPAISYLRNEDGFLLSSQWKEFSKQNPALAVEVYDAFVRDISFK